MSLHWYACISTNTNCFEMHHISLKTNWWALSNTSSIMRFHSAFYEILADKAFIATNSLISHSFVVAFVSPTYVQIALIWGFSVWLGLWKFVHLLYLFIVEIQAEWSLWHHLVLLLLLKSPPPWPSIYTSLVLYIYYFLLTFLVFLLLIHHILSHSLFLPSHYQ